MLLDAIDLTVGYQRPVVGPVSFRLDRGEAVGLCGGNGCGKSTLLRALAGEARIFGGRLLRAPGLRLGAQPQHPMRLPEMPLSGHDYLRLLDADRQPAPPRLRALLDRRIDALSGGQFQLLAIWACLAAPVDAVILDEPTNNLDPEGIELLLELLRQRAPEQALLLVSHDTDFMSTIAQRCLDITPRHRTDLEAPAP